MVINIKQELPVVSTPAIREWVIIRDGKEIPQGKYACTDVTAPNSVCESVYSRLNDYHDDYYVARTNLKTTRFSVYIAPGVNSSQFHSLLQAHVFVAYKEDDYERLINLSDAELKAEIKELYGDGAIMLNEIAEMVPEVILLLLRTQLKKRAQAVYSAHSLRMSDVAMHVVNERYENAVEALARLKFTDVRNFVLAPSIEQVERLLADMQVEREKLEALSLQIVPLKEQAEAISSNAERLAKEAAETEDAKLMLKTLDEINNMIPEVKALVVKSKVIFDQSQEPWGTMGRKLGEIQHLVPPKEVVVSK